MPKKNFLGDPCFGYLRKKRKDTLPRDQELIPPLWETKPPLRTSCSITGSLALGASGGLFICRSQRASKHSLALTTPCQPRIVVPILQMGELIERAIKWLDPAVTELWSACGANKELWQDGKWWLVKIRACGAYPQMGCSSQDGDTHMTGGHTAPSAVPRTGSGQDRVSGGHYESRHAVSISSFYWIKGQRGFSKRSPISPCHPTPHQTNSAGSWG